MYITLYSTAYINRVLTGLADAGLPITPNFLTALNNDFNDVVREYTCSKEFAETMTGKNTYIIPVITRSPTRISERHTRKYNTFRRVANNNAEIKKSGTASIPLEFTFYSNDANTLELLEEWLLTTCRSYEEDRIDLTQPEQDLIGVPQLSYKATPGEVGSFAYLGPELGSIFTLGYSAEITGVVMSPDSSLYPLLLKIYLRFYYKAKILVKDAPESAPDFVCTINQTI